MRIRRHKLIQVSRHLRGGFLAGILCSVAVVAVAADLPKANNAVPALMQEPGVAWRAYQFGGRTRPPSPAEVPYDRTANEWGAPESGIGPITADPAHPFYNNAVAADLGVSSTYRVADLGNEARSEEHTSELQSRLHLVCRLLLE